jgi:hypothetical protein
LSKVLVTDTHLSDIAAAIRQKNGLSTTYKPGQMAQAILDIPTGITPTGTVSITQNGTTDVTQYASADVNVPGSNPTIIYGSSVPSSSVGNNGDYYIREVPWSAVGISDSGLGWAVRSDCFADTANEFYGTLYGRTYYKSYNGPCVVCCGYVSSNAPFSNENYVFPFTASTVKDAARRTDSYSHQPSSDGAMQEFTFAGTTWYFDKGYGMGVGPNQYISDGIIGAQNIKRITIPDTLATWTDAAQYILTAVGICTPEPQIEIYKKTNGAWVDITEEAGT